MVRLIHVNKVMYVCGIVLLTHAFLFDIAFFFPTSCFAFTSSRSLYTSTLDGSTMELTEHSCGGLHVYDPNVS